MRMAWLCGAHRDDAVSGVGTKALSYGEWRARNLEFDNCPECNVRKCDESTRVWVCGACGEKVVAPQVLQRWTLVISFIGLVPCLFR